MLHSTRTAITTTGQVIAVLAVVLLLAVSCGSSDDGVTEVASQPEDNEPTEQTAEPGDSDETAVPEEPSPGLPDAIPVESPNLVGPEWYVLSVESATMDLTPKPEGAVARIRFSPDGTVTGNAGCNDFTAEYSLDGTFAITNFAIQEVDCFVGDWLAFVELLPQTSGFGSAGGPDPILFVGSDGAIALGATPPDQDASLGQRPADPASIVEQYIGLSELEAAQLADSNNLAFRVSSIDGEAQMLTMDYSESRINVDVVDGIVVGGTIG